MAGDGSVQRYNNPTAKEVQDTQGVAQFGRDGRSWNITISGINFQGGYVEAAGTVNFSSKFQKQLLGLFTSAGTTSNITNSSFQIAGAPAYWLAIGV